MSTGEKESHSGTIRMYFYYTEDTLVVLDAEYKTSERNVIERAKARMKEMMFKLLGVMT